MKLKEIYNQIKESDDTDYRGSHRAPDKRSGSPLYDVTLNGIYPDDVYSRQGIQYYGDGGSLDRLNFATIQKYHNKPNAMITIYRSVPGHVDKINVGDWVGITKQYVKEHGEGEEGWKVLTMKVKAKDIYTEGNSLSEWRYDPT